MQTSLFLCYVGIMALITYLLRSIPFAVLKNKVENPFFQSFLFYIPYTVLAAMTVPAILYCTTSVLAAAVGMIIAILLSLKGGGLLKVAIAASVVVFILEYFFV